jgi:dipeptidase E
MKLLLTSAGITNRSIATALEELVGKKAEDITIGFIPTAKNIESGNAAWFVKKLTQMFAFGFTNIDLIDPSACDVDWRLALSEKDVVLVGGGNTFHLLNQVRASGFDKWIHDNMDNKVYVGISAGSILATPNIGIASVGDGDENTPELTDLSALSLVAFEVSPHSPESVTYDENREYAQSISNVLYAYDDDSAVRINGKSIDIISEGQSEVFNLT